MDLKARSGEARTIYLYVYTIPFFCLISPPLINVFTGKRRSNCSNRLFDIYSFLMGGWCNTGVKKGFVQLFGIF